MYLKCLEKEKITFILIYMCLFIFSFFYQLCKSIWHLVFLKFDPFSIMCNEKRSLSSTLQIR